jgi:hypothetical protein
MIIVMDKRIEQGVSDKNPKSPEDGISERNAQVETHSGNRIAGSCIFQRRLAVRRLCAAMFLHGATAFRLGRLLNFVGAFHVFQLYNKIGFQR